MNGWPVCAVRIPAICQLLKQTLSPAPRCSTHLAGAEGQVIDGS